MLYVVSVANNCIFGITSYDFSSVFFAGFQKVHDGNFYQCTKFGIYNINIRGLVYFRHGKSIFDDFKSNTIGRKATRFWRKVESNFVYQSCKPIALKVYIKPLLLNCMSIVLIDVYMNNKSLNLYFSKICIHTRSRGVILSIIIIGPNANIILQFSFHKRGI